MQLIRFLLKFAFICNCCFLIVRFLQMFNTDGRLSETIKTGAVLGMLVAPFLNICTLVLVLVMLLLKRITWKGLPPWIFISNIVILLLQIFV